MAAKKNKHISNLTTADLKKKIAKKKKPANMCKGKAPMNNNVRIPVDSLNNTAAQSSKEFKIAKKDYDKFYKLGMKYAREYNKNVLSLRNELKLNLDQSFGWTDGFVEGALQTLYKGMEKREWSRYHGEA